MFINQLKDNLVSNLWLVSKSILDLPFAGELIKQFDCVGVSSIVSDGFKDKNDLTLNLSNPVFSPWHGYLDQIGSTLVKVSQTWELPLTSFSISGKSILFNVNREVAIPLILSNNIQLDQPSNSKNDCQQSTVLIVNTMRDNLRQLTCLRFQYIEETLVSLLKTIGASTKTINSTQTITECGKFNYCDDEKLNTNDIEKGLQFDDCSPLEINIDPFKSNLPYDLEESQFTIEPGSRLMSFLRLFSQLLIPSELQLSSKSRIVILIHINDWKIGEKAITSWSVLTSTSIDQLKWINFIPIADIISDLTLDEIKNHWRSIIVKQSETQYTDDQVNCLIETCLRYTITSISPKAFHNLDLSKYKEALFIQYNYARLVGITRKFQQLTTPLPEVRVDVRLLKSNQEWNLIYNFLAKVPVLLNEILQSNPIAIHKIPYFVKTFVNYISIYYNYTRVITEINDRSLPLANARIVMIDKIRTILHQLVNLIQIDPVQYM
ncbi:uncharacterized protein LOC128393081 [Panonychus citri]|uniref:uncharacterized protein LOC128393081 n=1 Tax=Panonychus citri TaxID=50023 RepID=UPI002307E240|nr:uncharacterized protein LOC128393081 [Panonychus citri]